MIFSFKREKQSEEENKYAHHGSLPLPWPFPKYSMYGKILSWHTAWNTFGPLTKLASADDNEAENIPAVMMGAQNEITLIIP